MEKKIEITRVMLAKGYEQGLVKIIEKAGFIVCEIGTNWFYFAELELERYSLEKFLSVTETDNNLDNIYRTLKDFYGNEILHDEYEYYYYYLTENLK